MVGSTVLANDEGSPCALTPGKAGQAGDEGSETKIPAGSRATSPPSRRPAIRACAPWRKTSAPGACPARATLLDDGRDRRAQLPLPTGEGWGEGHLQAFRLIAENPLP